MEEKITKEKLLDTSAYFYQKKIRQIIILICTYSLTILSILTFLYLMHHNVEFDSHFISYSSAFVVGFVGFLCVTYLTINMIDLKDDIVSNIKLVDGFDNFVLCGKYKKTYGFKNLYNVSELDCDDIPFYNNNKYYLDDYIILKVLSKCNYSFKENNEENFMHTLKL